MGPRRSERARGRMDKHLIGQEAARLLPLAQDVLRHYPFRVRTVEHLATHSNVLYRVVTWDGFQCVLRVGTPESNSRQNIIASICFSNS